MMTDRESAITHLMIISTWSSFSRERDLQFFTAKHLESMETWADEAIALLKEQEQIVRCKDCVYWQDNNDGYPHQDCKWREDETPDPDDYCSAGERKEDRQSGNE